MSNEAYAFALKNTLNEIKNTAPDISHAFFFKDGKIIAKDENTQEETANSTARVFNAITERADTIGGLESITFHGTNGKVNITRIDNFYLGTITSKEADEKYINTLTRVLVPTVLKLVEKIHPDSIRDTLATEKPEPTGDNNVEEISEDAEVREKEPPMEETDATEAESEPLLPEPPVNQLIVENLRGLLVPSDAVRIDSAVTAEWRNLYDDKKIEEVYVETLNGKTTRCKFKPTKGSKHEGKGIIQIPKKIQLTLQTKKGELIMVKPMVE